MTRSRIQGLISRIIIIGSFSLVCVLLVLAEEIQAEVLELERIVVSAKRFPEGLKGVAENVTVVSAEEISRMLMRPRGFNNKGVVDEYRRPKLAFRSIADLQHSTEDGEDHAE